MLGFHRDQKREGIKFPGAGVIHSYEPFIVGLLGTNPGLLKEQPELALWANFILIIMDMNTWYTCICDEDQRTTFGMVFSFTS